jgi:hypothetical protein
MRVCDVLLRTAVFVRKTTGWDLNFARPDYIDPAEIAKTISGQDKEKVAGSLLAKKKKKAVETLKKPLNFFCQSEEFINVCYTDLPGLLYGNKSKDDAEISREREELVMGACRPANRFILFVHNAEDEDDAAIVQLRKKIDPGRHRSALVYTRFSNKLNEFASLENELDQSKQLNEYLQKKLRGETNFVVSLLSQKERETEEFGKLLRQANAYDVSLCEKMAAEARFHSFIGLAQLRYFLFERSWHHLFQGQSPLLSNPTLRLSGVRGRVNAIKLLKTTWGPEILLRHASEMGSIMWADFKRLLLEGTVPSREERKRIQTSSYGSTLPQEEEQGTFARAKCFSAIR